MKEKRTGPLKIILGLLLKLIILLLIILIAYVAYVLIDYHRLDDNLIVTPEGKAQVEVLDSSSENTYNLTNWNIGFSAYTDQFSFFMDGGDYSRGFSKDAIIENTEAIKDQLKGFNSDLYLIQEVDFGSTRSHKVDEKEMLTNVFDMKYECTFGENYDSPYLFYPITSPIGASKSGMLTMSKYHITEAVRRSLPIQTSLAKYLDLDRAYVVNRIPLTNGKELILINLHLSAYTTDDTIVKQQLQMLSDTITEEYEKGNYVIAGGDFNTDLLQDSGSIFGVSGAKYSWAQPFPLDTIPEGAELIAPLDEANPVPSCRNADSPWDPKTNFQITIDGFIVTDNIEVKKCEVTDLQFAYSDHNPVQLEFSFKD